jgi:hypothetical protein
VTDPWADPSSPGTPYGGPPQTAPPVHGQPGPDPGSSPYPGYGVPYGYPPPYGYPGQYGYPGPWGPVPPTGPRRPGQVVAAAVLAFVQAGLVLLASVYVFFFASIARVAVLDAGGSVGELDELANEGSVLALIQVLSVVALVVGGVLALGRRRRQAFPVLVGALALQVVLAVYWGVRLSVVGNDLPGPDPATVFTWFSLFFAAMPVVALGLVLVGAGRRWFRRQPGGVPAGPA